MAIELTLSGSEHQRHSYAFGISLREMLDMNKTIKHDQSCNMKVKIGSCTTVMCQLMLKSLSTVCTVRFHTCCTSRAISARWRSETTLRCAVATSIPVAASIPAITPASVGGWRACCKQKRFSLSKSLVMENRHIVYVGNICVREMGTKGSGRTRQSRWRWTFTYRL